MALPWGFERFGVDPVGLRVSPCRAGGPSHWGACFHHQAARSNLNACQRCFASLFTNRAIHYRSVRGFDHFKVFLSIGIMKMVRSDLAASGVIFTLDTESGCRDIGLACMEFIISAYIKAHPMALLHPERVTDSTERVELALLTRQYATPADFFIEKLSEGIGTIAAAFYPRPVVGRMSDFKPNEYASLLGGKDFELVEANPMLGFRGASRYAHLAYAEGFVLECAALRRVREVMGLTNVKIMIPFCRRVEEGEKVLQTMAEHGLQRGVNGLEIYVMYEIPNKRNIWYSSASTPSA
jgi:phosphoenolpyruvate synthase/pyruvate phosphate dikinase